MYDKLKVIAAFIGISILLTVTINYFLAFMVALISWNVTGNIFLTWIALRVSIAVGIILGTCGFVGDAMPA